MLRQLAYRRAYAIRHLAQTLPLLERGSYRMSVDAPVQTIDDMIRGTTRGLLVTRFHNVELVDSRSVLCTGYTRDGLWLIENGKITRPVKNFRFTESPLFILNKLEAAGVPVRVFDREHARVVPALKVNDFSFTSLSDAV
jgi:predicted Zn-dependent protease